MLKTYCPSDLGRILLPNDESGDKSNHKHVSTYLKFVYKFRQLLIFFCCSSMVLHCPHLLSSYCDLESVGKRRARGEST